MDFLNLSDSTSAILAVDRCCDMFGHVPARIPPAEVVALSGAAVMLALGIFTLYDAQAVFAETRTLGPLR